MTTRLRNTARYSTLLEINRAAVTGRNLNEIFKGTCGALKKVIPYSRMGLSLYTPEQKALTIIAAQGQGAESFYQVGLTLDCKDSHHGWVFQHQKPIVRRNLQRELQFKAEQPNVDEGIRSYCAVPLIARGDSVGVMILLSSQRNSYSATQSDFLQEISNQFVLAVKTVMPTCPQHSRTELFCPRCIASAGGQATAAKYKAYLSGWGKQGGRGRKRLAGATGESELRDNRCHKFDYEP